jgi:DNA-binding SARP family transcriptional activator
MPDTEPAMEIRVLGPVEVSWDGRVVDIGGVKARALVARLLIDRGLVVPAAQLADSLWGDDDGTGAGIALRSTVSRVRRRLRDAGAPDSLIATRAPGYVLEFPAGSIDVSRFETLVDEGRQHLSRRRPREAVEALRAAEALWRGAAYSEVRDEPFARAEARRLEELRLLAIEARIDALLTIGRHDSLNGELASLTTANPLRERLWCQRMLALYRSGRQAEALRVFQDLRAILVAELGIEPGHDVTWLEHAILEQEPALDFAVPAEAGAGGTGPAAGAAPAGSGQPLLRLAPPFHEGPFVGRAEESATLRAWWAATRAGDRRLLIVEGDPGIGKTRLVMELVSAVEADDTLVLWGRCDEETVAPFQPFAEALGRYFQSASADEISRMPDWQRAELSRLVLRLREYESTRDDVGDPEGDRYRFFQAVTATLDDLADRGTVLLVLDDLHRADQATLLLLRHVLRNTKDRGLGIIGLVTDTEVAAAHPLRATLAELRAAHTVEAVRLRGLPPGDVEELVTRWGQAPSDLVPQLCRLTDGNPLFLDELLRQLRYRADEHGADGDSPLPPDLTPTESIRELVARRVSRLPEDVVYLMQAAAVAGLTFEPGPVSEAAGLSADQALDALDRAEESRLLRRLGPGDDQYAFSHALVRDAIYGELLRGRRVRYHHTLAVAMERAHPDEIDAYLSELAHHYFMGAAAGDADKARRYTRAAGARALRGLAFEEAVGHFARCLELCERFVPEDRRERCDALLGLAEAQARSGATEEADVHFARAAALARAAGDPERLAWAAIHCGSVSYLGIVRPRPDQVGLLEEALDVLPAGDSHLRAMAAARLGVGLVYVSDPIVPLSSEVLVRALALNADAIAMARRLNDLAALGYALNARMHALWGSEHARERLAVGTELGLVADDIGDESLALHGHMWRMRELMAEGDMDAVRREMAAFGSRDGGPAHPLEASFALNVAAMIALVAGDSTEAELLARQALEASGADRTLAKRVFGMLMAWTWWQRDGLRTPRNELVDAVGSSPESLPTVRAVQILARAEAGAHGRAAEELEELGRAGWRSVAQASEGAALAWAAAACSVAGVRTGALPEDLYEALRPSAGSVLVMRTPAVACCGPADHYLGLLAMAMEDHALAVAHFETACRLAGRMAAEPFVAASEMQLARVLRARGRQDELERAAVLLRHAEEAALRMGLHRIARLAADPD